MTTKREVKFIFILVVASLIVILKLWDRIYKPAGIKKIRFGKSTNKEKEIINPRSRLDTGADFRIASSKPDKIQAVLIRCWVNVCE